MEISQRIKAIAKLGKFLESAAANPDDAFLELVLKVKQHNGWFTEENVSLSISAWGKVLTEEKLEAWMSSYPEVAKVHPKRIGVIAAGNIPLVVFHDFLSVLMSGHCFVGKLSSTDNILLPAIVAKLIEIEPEFKDLIVLENGTLKNITD